MYEKNNMSIYQNIIHATKYARKIGSRLESYSDTVERYIDYMDFKFSDNELIKTELKKAKLLIKNQEVMPSMRLFFSAGEAVEKENAMAFNCKYQAINSLKSIPDLLYSLLCTCGVGVSVQSKFINQIPVCPTVINKSDAKIIVEDTRYGWADALQTYLDNVFSESISLKFDTHKVRDRGLPLKTSGGFASGPEPLLALRDFIEDILIKNCGKKLKPIDWHDIVCKTAECAVSGGVRRAAIITLFDEDDLDMLYAKSKENLKLYPYRYNSNNTMMWSGDEKAFNRAIKRAKLNGEPGFIFVKNLEEKMKKLNRISEFGFGVNPCGEVILMPNQFCDLVEAVMRPEHSIQSDLAKVRMATILALLQANLTNFNFISDEAKYNQENDPIIGVSLTGLYDCVKYTNGNYKTHLKLLKDMVERTVDEFWEVSGLKHRPKANTCIKPSGTVSQLVNCSSGIHPRYAKYYIRRIVIGNDSHLYENLSKSGLPFIDVENVSGRIFEFAMKAPEGAKVVEDIDAIQQLKYIHTVNEIWCDHNASCTIYVKPDEWESVENILKGEHNFIALSFLPQDINVDTSGFAYLPLEAIGVERYEQMKQVEDKIEWEQIFDIEVKKEVANGREFACVGGSCDI